MTRTRFRFTSLALAALAASALTVGSAPAATINSDIPVSGTFSSGLSGSGTVQLISASGTFRQWVLFSHVNVGVSANPQTVGLSVNPWSGVLPASGNVDLDYDNVTPGTPLHVNSVNADLNGNSNIPVGITTSPLQINTSLGNFNLVLTVNANITDLDFVSSGDSAVSGGLYDVPGNFHAILNGTVTGQLVGVPLIGNVNLGTLYTLTDEAVSFEGSIPGLATLSDLDGGVGPFPNDMLANFAASLPDGIPVPLSLPINVAINQSVPNGQSGFSVLNISGQLDANLTLNNPAYNLTGQVDQVLVPEPGAIVMGGMGLLGLAFFGYRRRKAA